MDKSIIIFGTHPLRESLLEQFREAGADVVVCDEFAVPGVLPDEAVVLPADGRDDADAEEFLRGMASAFKGQEKRPLVHLMLRDGASLRRLQVSDFDPLINEVFEVYPFTVEEAWADRLMVTLPGIDTLAGPSLDREPITAGSRQFVHLVIAGFDSYAESIAVRAAQVAHFPNYDGKAKQPLRTRITIVAPGIGSGKDAFISRYHNLFENSFYRTIFLADKSSVLHHPEYEGRRGDFVDVEWEFVDGALSNPVVVGKLSMWAKDAGRQLTVVISSPDDNVNIDGAMALPETVLDGNIPVWVRTCKDTVSRTLGQSPKYRGIIPFGMEGEGYDVRLPIMRMARLLHYFYACSYDSRGVPTSFPADEVEAQWRKAGALKMRLSNVCSVMTMATKMHSVGHDKADLGTFYALDEEEIQLLSRTEHNRWCVERLLSGTRVCTDDERAAIGRDISLKKEYKKTRDAHYDLCAYEELGKDEKGNDVRGYDYALTACIPLIIESYLKESGQ